MFGSKYTVPVIALAVFALIAVPVTIAVTNSDGACELVSVEGIVTEFVCCDNYNETDVDDCCDLCEEREGAFILETDDSEEVLVKFGPWWYWSTQEVTVKDVVSVGDRVNVTGVLKIVDDITVLEAWKIVNLDTGEDITIKVEGRVPWAGGPDELGIEPWPPSEEKD
ncbi:MAG: hypothetical protein MUO84_02135 [Thermoplasmata archaeon]|nr:hypothetical protein [Thermoplasmata archaeon]